MAGHHHRASTNFKQTNKTHRGISKGALKDAAKGRVERDHPKKASSNGALSKAARRNTAKQIQQQKRHALVTSIRSLDAPRVVVCLSLTEDIDPEQTALALFGTDAEPRGGRTVWPISVRHPRPAQLQLLCPSLHDLYGTLDACSVADYVLLFLSPSVEVDTVGETVLRSLCALGVPDNGVRAVVCGPSAPTSDVRKSLLSFSQHFFPSLARLYAASEPGEASNLVRSLCEAAPKGITWREDRGRVLVEEGEWRDGELRVTGVIRGAPMSADRLVHLPGIGDCQLDRILSAPASRSRNGKAPAMDLDADEHVLSERHDDDADDLRSVNSVDTLEGLQAEQTWPTADELASAPAALSGGAGHLPDAPEGTTPRLKRVPKGTSAYQAAWILEDDASDDDGDESVMDEDEEMHEEGSDAGPDEFEILDRNAALSTSGRAVSFADGLNDDPSLDLDSAAVDQERTRWRAAREEAAFPDEVDTPMHIPARERFARYRGLRSFRTSPWDAYENLPADYAKIYMFRDWRGVGRSVTRQEANDESAVQPGTRVSLVVKAAERPSASLPLVAWALHKHEHKASVAHCTVLRNTEFEEDVRSKDPLILQLGPRRFAVNPLFSQHTQANAGRGSNNVHKFERFLPTQQGGAPSMATSYLPITFGTAVPSLYFRSTDAAPTPSLVGSGTLHSCDPTRVIAKRIVLTGHPVKVHKRSATIRYLFFNPDDVAYFKPVQLRTKKGRTGYIRESLGTHGLLKAGFDGPLDQMDTVCLNLYKRCFPKWARPEAAIEEVEGQAMEVV